MSDSDTELRNSIIETLNRFQLEFSASTQAQMVVPVGTVRQLSETFERRIAEHQHERDSILIDRALRNTDDLIRQSRTYAEQLRAAKTMTLLHLPPDLLAFIRDHDDLYRAAVRSRQQANMAAKSPNMDIFARVAHRILNLRNVYSLNLIRETRSPDERKRMMNNPQFDREIRESTEALTDEMFRILSRLGLLLPTLNSEAELENVGPDHNVDDFGRDVASKTLFQFIDKDEEVDANDHSQRCCICLDAYNTSTHPSFLIAECQHIIGKPCLSTWLNDTSKNANLCPYCRTPLCERRARKPKAPLLSITTEQVALVNRLDRALDLLEDADSLYNEIFGQDGVVGEGKWLGDAMMKPNRRLLESGVEFGFMRNGVEQIGWSLRRVDWARAMLMA